MNRELFYELIEETRNKIKTMLMTDFKESYISTLMRVLNDNFNSSAVNDILKNKEKMFNVSYAEKLLSACGEFITDNMSNAGISDGRKITLWNQVSLGIKLPEFSPFVPKVEYKRQPQTTQETNSSDVTAFDYVLDALCVGVALTGVFAPIAAVPKILMIAGGTTGAIVETKKIIDANTSKSQSSSKHTESRYQSKEYIANEYRKQIERNCENVIAVFEEWVDYIISKTKENVGCEE